jgi:ketosteroid isomerase-like protein
MSYPAKKMAVRSGVCALLVILSAAVISIPAAAQKNKGKDKKKESPAAEVPADLKLPQTDSQQVDQAVGETLGYWQIGDTDSLRKYYDKDVVVVSGLWEPPVIGWDNYARVFQAQRAGVTEVRMDRSNTYIKVNGNSAWALPVELHCHRGREIHPISGAHHAGVQQASGPLADRPGPLVRRTRGGSSGAGHLEGGLRSALEALKTPVNPNPGARQQQHA